ALLAAAIVASRQVERLSSGGHDASRPRVVDHELHALRAHIQPSKQPHRMIPRKLALPQPGCRAPGPTKADAASTSYSGVAACTNSTHLSEKSLAALRNRVSCGTAITLALTFYFGL